MTVPTIFDPARIARRDARAAIRNGRHGAARWLRESLAEDIVERLAFLRWEGASARVSGDWSGSVARSVQAVGAALVEGSPLSQDAEIDGGPFDLIVSLCEVETINDLPGALIRIRRALSPGGMLLAAFPGAGSLPRLRAALLAADGERPQARIHPQVDAQAGSGLLQRAGFARQAVDHHALTVRYGSLETLVSDLRDQALTSVLADRATPLGKAAWRRAQDAFAAQADADGRVSETFEIVTLTAWRD